jgi:hypothetical protein
MWRHVSQTDDSTSVSMAQAISSLLRRPSSCAPQPAPLKVHLGPQVDFGELNAKTIKGLMYLSKIVSRFYLYIHE